MGFKTKGLKSFINLSKHLLRFFLCPTVGKPIIGIRTATHAFTGGGSFGGKISYGAFGPLVMGDGWVSHHGGHKRQGARGGLLHQRPLRDERPADQRLA